MEFRENDTEKFKGNLVDHIKKKKIIFEMILNDIVYTVYVFDL